VTVDVTVENVDDETRTYDLSLMADGVFANEWVAVDNASGQLMPGQSTTVTFETQFSTAGSWDLSIRRAAEREASIGPVTVDIDHSPSVDDWPIRGSIPVQRMRMETQTGLHNTSKNAGTSPTSMMTPSP